MHPWGIFSLVFLHIICWHFLREGNLSLSLLETTTIHCRGLQPILLVGIRSFPDVVPTITHVSLGTKIILQVMDSQGNTGGTGSAIYEIIESELLNWSCLKLGT